MALQSGVGCCSRQAGVWAGAEAGRRGGHGLCVLRVQGPCPIKTPSPPATTNSIWERASLPRCSTVSRASWFAVSKQRCPLLHALLSSHIASRTYNTSASKPRCPKRRSSARSGCSACSALSLVRASRVAGCSPLLSLRGQQPLAVASRLTCVHTEQSSHRLVHEPCSADRSTHRTGEQLVADSQRLSGWKHDLLCCADCADTSKFETSDCVSYCSYSSSPRCMYLFL